MLLLLLNHQVLSNSLGPHGLQHARLPCPSLLPKFAQTHVHWVRDAPISSSVTSCSQSFPASGSFPVSQLFTSGGQSIGASASASVLPMNIQGWFPLGLAGFNLLAGRSKRLSRVFSSITVWNPQFFGAQSPLWSNSYNHIRSLNYLKKEIKHITLVNPILNVWRSWWWTGKPGVLQSMGLQKVSHEWANEMNSLLL